MSTQSGTRIISKSTNERRPTSYRKQNGETLRIREKGTPSRQWKQIVEITELGKNKKGKKVFSSKTKHIPV